MWLVKEARMCAMQGSFPEGRWQVAQSSPNKGLKFLLIRAALGLFFGYLLIYFFMPGAGWGAVVLVAALLVVFAYIFETIHRK
jgi:hypothetical protein